MASALLLACIISAFTVSLCDWQHPHYSFRCLENGDVELFGLHGGSTIHMENSSWCSIPADEKKPVTIEKGCLDPEGSAISVHDPYFDETTTITPKPTSPPNCGEKITCLIKGTPTPTTIPYTGGIGTHTFTIKCMEIPEGGVKKTVAHVFQEKESNVLPDNYREVEGVEMRFKAVNNTEAPDISSIYVGDEFYMFIKYMGKHDYSLVPQKCSALKGTAVPKARSGNPVELWNNEKYGCVQHDELLKSFGRVNKTLVYAKMYGFRFTDDEYVTITCDVTMYPTDYPTDKEVCMKPITTKTPTSTTAAPLTTTPNLTAAAHKRKRRAITKSAPNKILAPKTTIIQRQPSHSEYERYRRNVGNVKLQTHTVLKKMRVFDSKDVNQLENKSQHNTCGISVWIAVLFTLYRQWM